MDTVRRGFAGWAGGVGMTHGPLRGNKPQEVAGHTSSRTHDRAGRRMGLRENDGAHRQTARHWSKHAKAAQANTAVTECRRGERPDDGDARRRCDGRSATTQSSPVDEREPLERRPAAEGPLPKDERAADRWVGRSFASLKSGFDIAESADRISGRASRRMMMIAAMINPITTLRERGRA